MSHGYLMFSFFVQKADNFLCQSHQSVRIRFLSCKFAEFHPLLYIFRHVLPYCCPSVVERAALRLCNSALSSANFFGSLTIVMRGRNSFHETCRGGIRRHIRSLAGTFGSML